MVLKAYSSFFLGKALEKLLFISELFLKVGSAFSIMRTPLTSLGLVVMVHVSVGIAAPLFVAVAYVDDIFSTASSTELILGASPSATLFIAGNNADRSLESFVILSVETVVTFVALSTLVIVAERLFWCCRFDSMSVSSFWSIASSPLGRRNLKFSNGVQAIITVPLNRFVTIYRFNSFFSEVGAFLMKPAYARSTFDGTCSR